MHDLLTAIHFHLQLFPADPPTTPPDNFDPAPAPPPGLAPVADQWIGYIKWIGIVAGIMGLMACGVMMMIGRRQRSHLAGEGAAGIPWVFAGLSVIALAAGIVTSILHS